MKAASNGYMKSTPKIHETHPKDNYLTVTVLDFSCAEWACQTQSCPGGVRRLRGKCLCCYPALDTNMASLLWDEVCCKNYKKVIPFGGLQIDDNSWIMGGQAHITMYDVIYGRHLTRFMKSISNSSETN